MPGEAVRRHRNNEAGRDQLTVDLLWGPIPEAQEPNHEPVRSDGRAPLAPLAPEQGGAAEILALTKMNCNNTQFDGGEPITIRAARHVADILRHVPAGTQPLARCSFAPLTTSQAGSAIGVPIRTRLKAVTANSAKSGCVGYRCIAARLPIT